MWEYKVVGLSGLDRESQLNEYGARGWELVAFDGGLAYLKQPKRAEPAGFTVTGTPPKLPIGKQRGK